MSQSMFEVGDIVANRARPDWGEGQVQSIIGGKVTVNFEHAGKIVLANRLDDLVLIRPDWE